MKKEVRINIVLSCLVLSAMQLQLRRDTFVQINRVPMELCVCRKDLKFNAILNHSDWGTFNEPKYDLSYKFFDTISSFRKVDRWFIICSKHMFRFDLVSLYERRENATISVK